jgi:hypothetical protein
MKKTLLLAVPGFFVGISAGYASPSIDLTESTFSGASFQIAADTTDEVDPSVSDQPFDSQDPDSIIRNDESLGEGMESGSASEVDPDIEGFDSQDQVGLEDEPRTNDLNVDTGSGSASEVDPDVEGFDSQDHAGLEDEPRTDEIGGEKYE